MTSDGTNAYTWNERNQLSSISGLYSASFEYDPFGRRLQKTISGTAADFLYDGVNAIQELSGSTVEANMLTGLGVDEYFTRTDSTGTSNFLTDALGSTLALADSSGTVQTQYTYDPFGATTVQGAASANSYDFTGRENDGQGLYYYRARYYELTLSRFLSQDPEGTASGANLYAYSGCSPTDAVDPTGTSFKTCKQALGDLEKAIGNIAKDVANAIRHGGCDARHQKELRQKILNLKKAIQQVEKYCNGPRWLGPGGAVGAALGAAYKLLQDASQYAPDAMEGLEGAAAGAAAF